MKIEYKFPEGFNKVKSIELEEGGIVVLQNPNFHGSPVTIGFEFLIREENEEAILLLSCKAAVCSEDEEFDANHGIDITLGRMRQTVQADQTFTGKNLSPKALSTAIKNYMDNKIDEIKEYISIRKDMNSHIDYIITERNKILKEAFKDFK